MPYQLHYVQILGAFDLLIKKYVLKIIRITLNNILKNLMIINPIKITIIHLKTNKKLVKNRDRCQIP